jgi:hypothetical protein
MSTLQKHYLTGVHGKLWLNRVNFLTTEEFINYKVEQGGVLIATFSFGELPMGLRLKLERKLREFKYIYFVYANSFDGVDNVLYFEKLAEKMSAQFESACHKDAHRRAWHMIFKMR